MTKLAITGVTGNLGRFLVKGLSGKGLQVRHLARRPEPANQFAGAIIMKAAYDKRPETLEALQGIDVLFMVSGHESPTRDQEHKDFIATAKKAGVRHIIYTSFMNPRQDATFTLAHDHAQTEAFIKELGLTYTFLRDNFYSDLFLDIAEQSGKLRGPAGNGKVSSITRADVAEVALTILENPQAWENQVLELTGPKALSMEQMAELLSKHLGKEISYYPEDVSEAYEWRKQWPAEDWQYDAWVTTYTAIAKDELSKVSGDVERVLGRPAKSFEDLLKSR